ncbi:putative rdr1p protein [Botrytis fragariae]|uniref:Putative rdr1p protein n=1 Tax=Botrytis fragariae TaxID=1964551 RepID=A0A8H6AIB4_9HELO|nr:putative rdr1p protein [Botrytis fragariae]KAF5867800.1 putative rdr1p protein [Botrytis fragariae]
MKKAKLSHEPTFQGSQSQNISSTVASSTESSDLTQRGGKHSNLALVINGKSDETPAKLFHQEDIKQGTASNETTNDLSILEPYKCRFTSANSAIAFPRCLGMELEMATPPRLHSYAWNTGIRSEAPKPNYMRLHEFCSWGFASSAIDVYFEHINPVFGFLEKEKFLHRCELFWKDDTGSIGFEALICGVVTLGALFTRQIASVLEGDVFEHGRCLLEQGSQRHGDMSLEHVMAWTLRALYLRSTSRPNLSSLAIFTTVHLAESIGLHRELDTVVFAVDGSRKVFSPDVLELRRRVFWIVMSLNQLFAAEYGRSKVSLDNVRCRKPIAKEGDSIGDLIAMAERLSSCTGSDVDPDALRIAIEHLSILPCNHSGLTMIKADVVLCLARKLHLTHSKFSSSVLNTIMVVLRSAFAESRNLSDKRVPWWNVVSVPFNTVCLLLSINTRQSISFLPQAMDTLEFASKSWDTHLSREAFHTAQMLVNRFIDMKREDQMVLESLHRVVDHPSVSSSTQNWTGTIGDDLFGGLNGQDFGWAQFFGDVVG